MKPIANPLIFRAAIAFYGVAIACVISSLVLFNSEADTETRRKPVFDARTMSTVERPDEGPKPTNDVLATAILISSALWMAFGMVAHGLSRALPDVVTEPGEARASTESVASAAAEVGI